MLKLGSEGDIGGVLEVLTQQSTGDEHVEDDLAIAPVVQLGAPRVQKFVGRI